MLRTISYLDHLGDVLRDHADIALHNLDGIRENVPGQLLDLLLEGGGEEHTLPVRPHVVTQGSNLEHFARSGPKPVLQIRICSYQ